jgi:flagellin-like hook-associated protein FlgL
LEGFGEHDPGYYDKDGVFHEGKNNYDYSVDYKTGKITIYNLDLMNDMRPPVPIDGNIKYDYRANPNSQFYDPRVDPNNIPYYDAAWVAAHNDATQYKYGQFELTFEYLVKGENYFGEKVGSHGKIYRAIEEGITMNINIGVDDLLRDKWTGNEMTEVMMRYSEALYSDSRDGIQNAITELTTMYDAVLNSQSQMGARIYRLELTLTRNEEQTIEVGTQQSSLEDADLADVISRLMLAENVYNAALQAAMRVIQPSLANFM